MSPDQHVLLCRHRLDGTGGVWTAPGGGVEDGETLVDTLRRELLEEAGFVLAGRPPHVWHRTSGRAVPGYDGTVHDYFLVRTQRFEPRATVDVGAEGIDAFRWWSPAEMAGYRGPDLFGPRDLAGRLAALIAGGVPARPIEF